MKPYLLKVCGLQEEESTLSVLDLPIQYAGFIFYHQSPRSVETIPYRIQQSLKKNEIPSVGVFVNASIEYIFEISKQNNLGILQLHGEETPQMCSALKSQGFKVWKAFSISESFDFEKLTTFENSVDAFLFDSKGVHYGGNGSSFSWEILSQYTLKPSFILSGGIGMDSLEALRNFHHPKCIGLDLNSKFEYKAGHKNTLLLSEFITNVTEYINVSHS